ncbi:hypothetical protein DER46DRAFT_663987 [Fusarium sp. MPI-SDFR-AT-0072]|nr:hypothetical protein DER46DRAFT_663987 [Fusarium sp. MPI-SDFR-AT-0072]
MRSSRSVLNHVRVQSLAPRRFSTMPAFRQIERGQVEEDKSQATGLSKVPKSVQDAVPKGVEESLPDSIHLTGSSPGQSTNKTHAKNDGEESMLPKKVQEKVLESVERAVPNAIHDTGCAPVTRDKK